MSGYISRSKLIKDVENLKDCYNGFSDTYDKACIIGLIAEQPSIEEPQKPKWISVKERLPDKNGKYLTVFTVNSIPPRPVIEVSCYAKDLYKIDKYDFQDKKKKSGFYQYDSEWGYFEMSDISHWMPLPIPPLPEDSEA